MELALLRVAGVAQPEYAELAFGEKMVERGPRDAASRAEAFTMQVDTDLGVRNVQLPWLAGPRGCRHDRWQALRRRASTTRRGRRPSTTRRTMMDGVDLQLRLYLLVLERFWGITPVGALYLGFGDGVRRGALRAEFRGRFAGIEEGPVKLLSPDEWDAFVGETPGLIAELVNRLVTLDVRAGAA